MRKLIRIASALICVFMLGFFATGCADANGLHNQEASYITIKFTNFKAAKDGTYSVPGGFINKDDWSRSDYVYTDTMITLKEGEGTTTVVQKCILKEFDFSLVSVGSWQRSWYPTVKGNAYDPSTSKYWNFGVWASGCGAVTLGVDATIIVDGSTSPATLTLVQ
jgi:hypothetical protein